MKKLYAFTRNSHPRLETCVLHLLPPPLLQTKPLRGGYPVSCTWIFRRSEEEPEKNAHDIAKYIQHPCTQDYDHTQFNKHGL